MVFLMEEQRFSVVERKHNCVHGTFGVSIFLEEQLDFNQTLLLHLYFLNNFQTRVKSLNSTKKCKPDQVSIL